MKVRSFTKKLLLIIACACFMLAICLLASCNQVIFNNFNDITVKVAYGSTTSMLQYVTAIDQNGKAYRCSIQIFDADGNPVEVNFDRFNVTSMNGYTAITTVKGFNVSRKINIVVEDRSTIFIEDFSDKLLTGYVGEEYMLPDVEINKISGEVIVPEYKIYHEKNGESLQVDVDGKSFTPTESGVYTLEVSATDKIGATNTKSAQFNVRASMLKNMLEDFNDELSVSTLKKSLAWGANEQIQYGDGFYTTWHENFDDRVGVVESALNTNLNMRRICATFGFSSEVLSNMIDSMSNFDYISTWIWLDKDGQFDVIRQENPQDSSTWTVLNKITGKRWQEVKIYKDALKLFAKLHANNGSGDQLFFFHDPAQNLCGVKYYIDSISLIKANFDHSNTLELNKAYTLPKLSLVGVKGESIIPDASIEFNLAYSDVSVPVIENTVTPTIAGKYDVIYEYQLDGVDYQYKNSILVGGKEQSNALNLEDFNINYSAEIIKENKVGFTYLPNGFYSKWHDNYQNRYGVIETVLNDDSSTYRRVNLKLNKTETQLNDLTSKLSSNGYVAIDVYIDLDGEFTVRNFGTWDILSQKITGKTWQQIKITKAMLDSNEFAIDKEGNKISFNKAIACDNDIISGIFYISSNSTNAIKIYLDKISVIDYNLVNDTEPQKDVLYTIPNCYAILNASGEQINEVCSYEIKCLSSSNIPTINNGKVTFTLAGNYVICYKYNDVVIYEKHIEIERLSPTVVEDFNHSSSINSIVNSVDNNSYTNTAFYVTWHAEYGGKTGVIETITNNNSDEKRVCGLNERLLSMAQYMDDNDYVSMVIYVDSTKTFQFTLNKSWGDNYGMPHVKGGEWQEIKISKSMLTAETSKGERLLTLYAINVKDQQFVVYIDDIRVVNVD